MVWQLQLLPVKGSYIMYAYRMWIEFYPVVVVFRRGSFHAEPPPPKQKVVRQSRAPTKETTRAMPTQVADLPPNRQGS